MTIDSPTVTGKMTITAKGIGYIKNPEFAQDIEVQNSFLNTALHGDEVEAKLHAQVPGMRQTGEVTAILHRAKAGFVGVLEKAHGMSFLVPDDKKMYMDLVIPEDMTLGAKDGEKVYAVMTHWSDPKKNPEGKVTKVLGKKGDNNVEMLSIVLEKGFDTDFPDEVVTEANEIEKNQRKISDEEVTKRRDMRDTFTTTIDPHDAKDFDDALSLKELPNGNFEVGIHIADVSHYVREGNALDKEALKRGCSIYLVDRTIPMLPHVLSTDVCSLNPHEDKLTFSAVFELTPNAQVVTRWFGRTVINSDKRFVYEEAQEVMDAQAGNYLKELMIFKGLAEALRKEKTENGAIDFETTEVKFKLDENGKPLEVYKKERLDTHRLVEDFMLLANREVAKYLVDEKMKKKEDPIGVFRVHPSPDKEKLGELSIFLKALGFDFDVKKDVTPKDFQKLIKEAEGDVNENLIKTTTIRTMAKAIYDIHNTGHFGLAFKFYTHFTSPIRRYPDLLVHRLLQDALDNKNNDPAKTNFLMRACKQSTEQEIYASDAERSSIKYKQVEYMTDHVGKEFNGVITGVTEWGIYVEEEETKCEGMVKLRDLTDDFYTLDAKRYMVKGSKGKTFTLGDRVKIKVLSADMEKKVIDYAFI